MPTNDDERLSIAEQVMAELADERTLSAVQARSFVRCLQTEWDVEAIAWRENESEQQLRNAIRLVHAASIFRDVEGGTSGRAKQCFRRAGELLEWLSRAEDDIQSIAPITLLAAAAHQLGGLPAMAAALLRTSDSSYPGSVLLSRFLKADFDGVLDEVASFWGSHADLTLRQVDQSVAAVDETLDISWVITVEIVRALGLLADSLRRDSTARASLAIDKLVSIERAMTWSAAPDIALLINLLVEVAQGFRDASIYRPISQLAVLQPDKASTLRTIARGQYSAGRGVLWASQSLGLERLISQSSFAMCTPTGSGKTLVANLALVKELILHNLEDGLAPLALYLVPSRALAGEVEANLAREMKNEFVVTGLYGGTDWGVTDAWMTSEQPVVLVATVEKADALMRYLGRFLLPRLRLLVVDEAHQVVPNDREFAEGAFAEHSERSIRLESFVSRLLAHAPNIARVALTAVAGGAASPVARWIEGAANATPVGLDYRSTRQLIGVLRTRAQTPPRIQIDLMNGTQLRVRQRGAVYINLRVPPMPQLPSRMRNVLNRFNQTDVLWTALHLKTERLRILISIAQQPELTLRWYREAMDLSGWDEAAHFDPPEDIGERSLYEDGLAACIDYCGEQSHETSLLRRGIATSHGQMPQRLRRLMTSLIERGICSITVATATLTEGVNLPFDLVFVPQIRRRRFDPSTNTSTATLMTPSEFNNLAGRAGRPGSSRGIEGITLVALPFEPSSTASGTIPTQRRQINELRDDFRSLKQSLLGGETESDQIESPLAMLMSTLLNHVQRMLGLDEADFLEWLEETLPQDISGDAGKGEHNEDARLADTLDELDGVLLTAIEELNRVEGNIEPARREAFLADLWRRTFSAVAGSQEEWMEAAFVRRGHAFVETLYPDPDERSRLYSYGYPPQLGLRFGAVVEPMTALIKGADDYGVWTGQQRFERLHELGSMLADDRGYGFKVRESASDQEILANWSDVLAWWTDLPGARKPEPDSLRGWQRFVSDNLEFRLGVAIGAVIAAAWMEGTDDPLTPPSIEEWQEKSGLPWFGFWVRELLRWGTLDPFVAFVMAQGLAKTRYDAAQRRSAYDQWLAENVETPTPEDHIDPQLFLRWRRTLPRSQVMLSQFREVEAELTGADGSDKNYAVIPLPSRDRVAWLDPAGYELARSALSEEAILELTQQSDYELRVSQAGAVIRRVFRGHPRAEFSS